MGGLASYERRLFKHRLEMPIDTWREWWEESSFREALVGSTRDLLSGATQAMALAVLDSNDPAGTAAVDTALRIVRRTARVSGRGSSSFRDNLFRVTFDAVQRGALATATDEFSYLTVSDDSVMMRGAILLAPLKPTRIVKVAATSPPLPSSSSTTTTPASSVKEETPSLASTILRLAGPGSGWLIAVVSAAVVAMSILGAIEVLFYRAALDAPRMFPTLTSRVGLATAIMVFLVLVTALDFVTSLAGSRLGRLVEMRMRMTTLHALPRTPDSFVRSRPVSDLAARAHNLVQGRSLPSTITQCARAVGNLALTFAAILLIDWRNAVVLVAGSIALTIVPVATRSRLREIDNRFQAHAARLLTLFLDALRGTRPVRLHGYQDAFRNEQRDELMNWRRTGELSLQANGVIGAVDALLGKLLVLVLFFSFVVWDGDDRAFLVLAFWAFRIDGSILSIIGVIRGWAPQRQALTRLLEITKYAQPEGVNVHPPFETSGGVDIRLDDVSVEAGGHLILENVSLDIPKGQHVAIVGASGSGKSTLVGLLLGHHRPARGTVLVDGEPLTEDRLRQLRMVTSWVDPAVQLWNQSLFANVEYAARGFDRRPFLEVLESSELLGILQGLDRGLETELGAEGCMVSGGEGQRVRVGRALLRKEARLVVLDEAFRGLDRETRRRLTKNLRKAWQGATLLFVSHDISHALDFDRVIVVEGGHVVEDGNPATICSIPRHFQAASHFQSLLEAEEHVLKQVWGGSNWRRIYVRRGKVNEDATRDA